MESNFHVECDLGALTVTNITELVPSNQSTDLRFKSISLHAVKEIFSQVSKLPKEYKDDVCVVQLPDATTILPREKPIPKPRELTKWERFAKEKGIQKRQKQKSLWDDSSEKWKPRFGYRSAKNTQDDWMVEVPNNADPNVDYFAKKHEEKAERIAKNEYQRLRNIAENNKLKVSNIESFGRVNKTQLTRSLASAKTATASLGKYAKNLPKEKIKNIKKHKFKTNVPKNLTEEKDSYLKVLENINKGKPKLEINEAVQVHLQKKQKPSKPDYQMQKKGQGQKGKNKKQKGSFKKAGRGKKDKFKKK